MSGDRERFERELDEGCDIAQECADDTSTRQEHEEARQRFEAWRAKFINNWAPRKEAINGS